MVSILPYSLSEHLAEGTIDFDTNTFHLMLLTAAYTPSQAHTTRASVEAQEVSAVATNYTTGGAAIVATTSRPGGLGETQVAFGDVVWDGATGFTARWGAIVKWAGGASSADPLVAIIDFGGNVTPAGGDLTAVVTGSLKIRVP